VDLNFYPFRSSKRDLNISVVRMVLVTNYLNVAAFEESQHECQRLFLARTRVFHLALHTRCGSRDLV